MEVKEVVEKERSGSGGDGGEEAAVTALEGEQRCRERTEREWKGWEWTQAEGVSNPNCCANTGHVRYPYRTRPAWMNSSPNQGT